MWQVCKFCLLGLISWSASLFAAPMGYVGSTMSMGDFSTNWREFSVNHAITSKDAFGVDYTYMRSDDKQTTRELVEANYTRLLYRNNLPDAQANLWFVVGVGGIRGTGITGTEASVTPGVQVDYETTRVYFSAMGRLYRARGVNNGEGKTPGQKKKPKILLASR